MGDDRSSDIPHDGTKNCLRTEELPDCDGDIYAGETRCFTAVYRTQHRRTAAFFSLLLPSNLNRSRESDGGRMAERLGNRASYQKVAGSIPI